MLNVIKNKLFFSIDKVWLWIFISLTFKTFIFLFLLAQHQLSEINGFWGSLSGDSTTYLFPLENYVKNGSYDPDFRAPALAPIYILLRFFFSMVVSCNLFLILQLVLSALSVYVLAKAVFDLTKSNFLFYAVFYIFLISTYSNIYDVYFLTESLCTSFTVFFVYYIVQFHLHRQNKTLLICSLLFTWLLFLRPVCFMFAFFIIIYFYILYRKKQINFKTAFISLVIFFSSFLVFDGWWMGRNYQVHHKFIPMRKSIYYERANNDYYENLGRFLQSWGGDIMFWNPEAEIRWFNYKSDFVKSDFKPQLPDYIFTSAFNMDTLLKLKQMITDYPEKYNLPQNIIYKYDEINNKCKQYELSVQHEKPFVFYVVARLMILKKFIVHSGTYNLFNKKFSDLNIFSKLVKLFYEALYWIILLICLTGVFIFPYRNKAIVFFLPVIYTLLVIPFGFKFCEHRYLVPAYPFMVVSACFLAQYYFIKISAYLKR